MACPARLGKRRRHRLNVFPIEIAPLRQRKEDIAVLASHFVELSARKLKRPRPRLTQANILQLQRYDWPGNIRELQNVIERSAILCSSDILTVDEALGHFEGRDREPASSLSQNLEEVERANIRRALEESGWKVKGEGNAASRLGINPSTLRSRMKRLGIARS